VTELPTELVGLTPEQDEIVRTCRRFAAEEIRPIARAVDDADIEVPWEIWH
jgi:alkylation response protein AidB-like acyl-CoA dehydrogenase